jgi:uncharacterized protein YukE
MNEGENSSMPQSPNFSSPNISAGGVQPSFPTNTEPIQPAITSTDVAAMSGTGAGAVAAAAAALPENDAPATISSSPAAAPVSTAQRSRFNFGANRFHAKESQPAAPTFAGAPDYFNQAAGDIYLENEYQENKGNKKKLIFIIAGVAVAAIAVLCLVIFGISPSTPKNNVEVAEGIFNAQDVKAVAQMETLYRHVITNESKSADVINLEGKDKLVKGSQAYRRILDELSKNKDAVKSITKDVDINGLVNTMNATISIYEKSSEELSAVVDSLANNNDDYESKVSGDAKTSAQAYVKAYREYEKNAKEKKSCKKTNDTSVSDVCDGYDDALNKNHSIMKKSSLARDILVGNNKETLENNGVSKKISKIYSALNTNKQKKDKQQNEEIK